MSTPPTSTPWVPMAPTPALSGIPPLVNGKWAKAEGGALVWRDPRISIPDTAWHVIGGAGEIPFENGWQSWPDGNYSPARYRRLSDGYVVLEGLIGYTGTQGAAAFTLPVGWRSKNQVVTGSVAIRHIRGASNYVAPWGTYWVYADGRVVMEHPGAVFWISLNNIRFYAGD